MEYLLLIYEDETRFPKQKQADFENELGQYREFGKNYQKSIKGGNALQPTPTAKCVRVRDGKAATTDGPFAETKEQLGGYYLISAESEEEAAKAAAQIPGARYGCVEVRPIMTFGT
jgi:hypothetical protein